jgi:hypothetical protein
MHVCHPRNGGKLKIEESCSRLELDQKVRGYLENSQSYHQKKKEKKRKKEENTYIPTHTHTHTHTKKNNTIPRLCVISLISEIRDSNKALMVIVLNMVTSPKHYHFDKGLLVV